MTLGLGVLGTGVLGLGSGGTVSSSGLEEIAVTTYLLGYDPDYNTVLDITISGPELPLTPIFPGQVVDVYDDGSEQGVSFGGVSCSVDIPLEQITDAGFETLLDYYFDTAKANARERSFPWLNPGDEETYVVKFDCDFQYREMAANYKTCTGIKFLVLGKFEEEEVMMNTDLDITMGGEEVVW